MENVIILGSGGHANVVKEILELNHHKILGYYDDNGPNEKLECFYYGTISSLFNKDMSNYNMICAIGNNKIRQEIVNQIKTNWLTCIHPTAIVSKKSKIGKGTIVCANSVIGTNTIIGDHCIINTSSSVDHDCEIFDFVHVAPGVHLCGNVIIDSGCLIGVGTSIIPCIKIGKDVVIGANSTVIRNIKDSSKVYGIIKGEKESVIPKIENSLPIEIKTEIKTPKVAVYTAVFGGYEDIKIHCKQTIPCDFFFFTDDISNLKGFNCPIKIVQDTLLNEDKTLNSVMKNVFYRCFPFKIPQLKDYDIIIYFDGNVQIIDFKLIEHYINKIKDYSIGFHIHPERTCIYDEANLSSMFPKYKTLDLYKQTETYKKEGYPYNNGLYWNGIIVYNQRHKDIKELIHFQEEWYKEFSNYHLSFNTHPQGQVSLPYILWKTKLSFLTLEHIYFDSNRVIIFNHKK